MKQNIIRDKTEQYYGGKTKCIYAIDRLTVPTL